MAQGRDAMFALRNFLEDGADRADANWSVPWFRNAVIFTDTDWPAAAGPPSCPVLGSSDLFQSEGKGLAQTLLDIASGTYVIGGDQSAIPPWRGDLVPFDLENDIFPIVQYVFPTDLQLPLMMTPRSTSYSRIENRLVQLNHEQFAALQSEEEPDRCLYQGDAGTGKTMLAIELARRHSQAGERVALICYNVILGDFLHQQSTKGFKIGDSIGAFWDHFGLNTMRYNERRWRAFSHEMDMAADDESPNSHGELYTSNDYRYGIAGQLEGIFEKHLLEAWLDNVQPLFDYLVVDELQTFCADPYLSVMDAALKGGLKGGRWAMFADFKQFTPERVPTSGIDNLDSYTGGPDEYAQRFLTIHCRNASAISAQAGAVMGISDDPNQPELPKGPSPNYYFWRDEGQLLEQLRESVGACIRDGDSPDQISILSIDRLSSFAPTLLNPAVNIYNDLKRYDCPGIYWPIQTTCGQDPCCRSDPSRQPPHLRCRQLRRFQGMESKSVILIVNQLRSDWHRNSLYVGITRARIRLIVLAHESTSNYLNSLVSS